MIRLLQFNWMETCELSTSMISYSKLCSIHWSPTCWPQHHCHNDSVPLVIDFRLFFSFCIMLLFAARLFTLWLTKLSQLCHLKLIYKEVGIEINLCISTGTVSFKDDDWSKSQFFMTSIRSMTYSLSCVYCLFLTS